MPGRSEKAAAALFAVALVGALVFRLRFGADLTDETFSIALPYRFVLGDVPFVDEVSTAQTAGVLAYPFAWLYVKIAGGTTGIVLFFRALHFAVKALAAAAVFVGARAFVASEAARIVLALVPLAYVPHSIPNVGYNVLATTFLAAGAFLSVAGVARSPRGKILAASGASYAIATFAYPPVAPAAVVAALLVAACAPRGRRARAAAAVVAGAVLVAVAVAPALVRGGVEGIAASFRFGSELVPRPPEKLLRTLADLWQRAPLLLVGGYAAAFATRWLPRAAVVVAVPTLMLVTVLWFGGEATTGRAAQLTVVWAGLLAPAMLLAARADRRTRRGAALVVAPAWVAGLLTAFASSNETDNAAIGIFPAAILFAALAAGALERADADVATCALPVSLVAAALVVRTYQFVYRDAPLAELDVTIASGPFRGIRTTRDRAALFSDLEEVFRRYDRAEGRVLILYERPGAHLFSRMAPSSNTVWTLPFHRHDDLLAYHGAHATGRGLVVVMADSPRPPFLPDDLVLERRAAFTVYREAPR